MSPVINTIIFLLVCMAIKWIWDFLITDPDPKDFDDTVCPKCGGNIWWFDRRQFYCDNAKCEYHSKRATIQK